MSECCLPNLGCLAIPIVNTNILGPPGPAGAAGRSIVDEYYEPSNGELTLTFDQAPFTYTTSDLRGAQGGVGATGFNGVSRLYTDIFTGNTTSAVINNWESMGTYTLAADELINIGDAVVINYEMELLLPNTFVLGARQSPLRRISIGAGTSLTKYDSTNPLGEPPMPNVSAQTAFISYTYKTTLEIIKASTSIASILRKCTFDAGIDIKIGALSLSFSNGTGSLLNINTSNPIVFSFDIYQYQATEIRMKSVTIDKISAQ
jgi:hypothetical protein